MVWIYIILHLLIAILLTMYWKKQEELHKELLLPLVYLVPFFGPLCFIVRERKRKHRGRERSRVEYKYGNLLVGKYQKIEVDENQDAEVVPLEEALLVNDTSVRHELMLNILHKNPEEYLSLLQKASGSDDTEVTHYATTVLMEILTEYEKNMQEFERRYQENKDAELITDYILYCNQFINAKLLTGNIEKLYRRKLSELILELFSIQERKGRLIFICIENDLELGDYEHAREMLEIAQAEYPMDERVWILSTQYYDHMHQYDKIQKLIRQIREKDVILSHEGKKWLAFWGEQ